MGGPNSFNIHHYFACHVKAANLTSLSVKAKLKAESQKLCPKSEEGYASGCF
jgi:hypothetical protein